MSADLATHVTGAFVHAGVAKLQSDGCQLHSQPNAGPGCVLYINSAQIQAASLSIDETCLVITLLILV